MNDACVTETCLQRSNSYASPHQSSQRSSTFFENDPHHARWQRYFCSRDFVVSDDFQSPWTFVRTSLLGLRIGAVAFCYLSQGGRYSRLVVVCFAIFVRENVTLFHEQSRDGSCQRPLRARCYFVVLFTTWRHSEERHRSRDRGILNWFHELLLSLLWRVYCYGTEDILVTGIWRQGYSACADDVFDGTGNRVSFKRARGFSHSLPRVCQNYWWTISWLASL